MLGWTEAAEKCSRRRIEKIFSSPDAGGNNKEGIPLATKSHKRRKGIEANLICPTKERSDREMGLERCYSSILPEDL